MKEESGLDRAAIERVTDAVLEAVVRGEVLAADGLLFLLRRYTATGREDIRDALEPALAEALESDATDRDRAAWLMLFAEASAASGDERLREAVLDLTASLSAQWGRGIAIDEIAGAVNACLSAGHLVDPQRFIPGAIDELERIVGAAYRPGEGLAQFVDQPGGTRGRLVDHVRAAAALLTAFAQTGRMPYSMLAEELMQFARRTLWDVDGGFHDTASGPKPFGLNCEAARVLCRLAGLHRHDEYRRTAVVAHDADYGRDAARTLAALASAPRQEPAESAAFGLALGEWLAL